MTNRQPGSDDQCRVEHHMLEYNIQKLIEKVDTLQTTVNTINTDVNVLNTKVDDFSNRLRKLEDRDEKIQQLAQKLELIIEKLEPDVEQLAADYESLDKRVTKIENNWGWVCTLVGFVAGFLVWGIQFLIQHFFLHH